MILIKAKEKCELRYVTSSDYAFYIHNNPDHCDEEEIRINMESDDLFNIIELGLQLVTEHARFKHEEGRFAKYFNKNYLEDKGAKL